MANLDGKNVAIICTIGVERSEILSPLKRLRDEGANVHVITPKGELAKSMNHVEWAEEINADKSVIDADPIDYDMLVLPGRVMNPDHLRLSDTTILFIKRFGNLDKPIAAICHGPWTLIDAGLVKGKRMISYPSIKNDLINAGANWVDEEVVIDGKLITSRNPDDLDAFNDAIVGMLE